MTRYGVIATILATNSILTFILNMIEIAYVDNIDPDIFNEPVFELGYVWGLLETLWRMATFQVLGLPLIVTTILGIWFYISTVLIIFIIVEIIRGV